MFPGTGRQHRMMSGHTLQFVVDPGSRLAVVAEDMPPGTAAVAGKPVVDHQVYCILDTVGLALELHNRLDQHCLLK